MGRADPTAVIPPLAVGRASCPACGHPLVRAETGWVCPKGLGHTRIVDDSLVVAVLFKALPRTRPEGMSVHQWGWYRSRRKQWAERVLREILRRGRSPEVGGGRGRKRVASHA